MLRSRVLTALVLAPPVVAGVWFLPGTVFALLAGLVFLVAGWEWTRLVGLGGPLGQGIYLVVMATLTILLGWLGLAELAYPIAVTGVIWWCLAVLWLCRYGLGERGGLPAAALKGTAGLLVLVPSWALLAVMQASPVGPPWVLMLLGVVWAADVCAYFAGKRYGHRKLAPRISPGKTWAGIAGAAAGAVTIGLAGGLLLQLGASRHAGLLALILATVAFSVVGDLFESLIKRHAGAKDSSTLLPGHGGVFDRLDSLFASLPVFYWGFEWLNR